MVARTCAARFSIRTVAVRDLPAFFVLALAAGEDSLANAVLSRQLAVAPTDSQRTWVLAAALDAYLAATPARIDAAHMLVTRDSGVGPTDRAARFWLKLHLALLNFWGMEHPDAFERVQMADSILRFVRDNQAVGLTAEEKQFLVGESYRALMSVAYLTHVSAPDSALLQLAQQAKDDLTRIPPDTVWYNPRYSPQKDGPGGPDIRPAGRSAAALREAGYKTRVAGRDWHTTMLPELVREFAPSGSVVIGDSVRHSRPLHALLWLPPGTDTAHNPSGTLEVRYRLTDACLSEYTAPLWDVSCSTPLLQLQQWLKIYGAQLHLTAVSMVHGHALYAGPQTPLQEAQTIAWYVRDYWHLPARVALLPPPSAKERRQHASVPAFEVIDDAGQVIYRGSIIGEGMQNDIPFLNALLMHALAPVPPASESPPR
jgi:hypothetical protein